MTEAEWINGTRSVGMLLFLRERAGQRKMLLFNIACCRRVWTLLTDEDQNAVGEFEKNADDPVAVSELGERYSPPPIRHRILNVGGAVAVLPEFEGQPLESGTDLRTRIAVHRGWGIGGLAFAAAKLVADSARQAQRGAISFGDEESAREMLADFRKGDEEREQSHLLRDIFGNPFHPVAFSSAWRTSTAVMLASQMYESRDFSSMPILADALQDSGCENADILDHCRGDGPHVRGCWVVDQVLGKS